MTVWEALTGKKTHCAACGTVIPSELVGSSPEDSEGNLYCSEACLGTIIRLSTLPPPPPEGA